MKSDFMRQGDFGRNMKCVADRCVMVVSIWLFVDKSARLFVDLPVIKAIFSAIPADLSCTPLCMMLTEYCSKESMPAKIIQHYISGKRGTSLG
jgi:hypothetical protein